MARGIEGTNIFRTDKDRNDVLDRLAAQRQAEALKVITKYTLVAFEPTSPLFHNEEAEGKHSIHEVP